MLMTYQYRLAKRRKRNYEKREEENKKRETDTCVLCRSKVSKSRKNNSWKTE